MGRRIFKYSLNFKISKKELRKYGSFNFPELMMDDIIDNSLMQVANGLLAGGETGVGFITYMLWELQKRNAITLNEAGKSLCGE